MLTKFKAIFRHFWRYKLFTALNVWGLAIGISACWVIYRIVSYEFSYDTDIPYKENIYKVVTGSLRDDQESYSGGVSAPLYQGVRTQISGLQQVVPVQTQYINSVEVNNGTQRLFWEEPKDIIATDDQYFSMLPYHWLAGSAGNALKSPENIVLTQSRAKLYFPGKNPSEIIGQTIKYYAGDTLVKKVTGVVADMGTQTEFTAKEFFALREKTYNIEAWTNTSGGEKLYLQLKQETKPANVLKQIEEMAGSRWNEVIQKNNLQNIKLKRWFQLIPLSELHFSTHVNDYNVRKVNKTVLYGLAAIAVFLLLLASINYINICIAQIPQRAKEIAVHKTLGGNRFSLISRFLNETVFITLLAFLLAVLFVWIGFGLLSDIIPPEITPVGSFVELLVFSLLLMATLAIIAGVYPAWLIANVKTIRIFRNHQINEKTGQRFNLQKALTVFQFAIALVFITSSIIMGKQLKHALKSDLGFNREAILMVNIPWKYMADSLYRNKQFTLLNELKKEPAIGGASVGTPPTEDLFSSPFEFIKKDPVTRLLIRKSIDTNYISLYKMKLLAGRNLKASDTVSEYIINEAAMHAFGFASPQDAIGKTIKQLGRKNRPIVGVVKDFHLEDFYKKIEPAVLQNGKERANFLSIKLDERNPSKWQAALAVIETKWDQLYPSGSFSCRFYDQALEDLYKQERNLTTLINIATVIAIFISCLGLFGLVTLTAYQRTKEIGIRKVMGASPQSIVRLLSKDYLSLVIISFAIAAPVAWWGTNKWLEKFVYRIEIQWWMFAVACIAAILIDLLTISFQAIKAAVANPVKSLRSE
ncbi:MAG: ABC transporter permease [Agriterribacter sp.]